MSEIEEIRPVEEKRQAKAEGSRSALPQARSMTRRERKAFLAAGADPGVFRRTGDSETDNPALIELNEKMVDWILENIYPDYNFDDTPNGDCIKLAQDTYALTMGVKPEALKNS